jgi:hypothetical protein
MSNGVHVHVLILLCKLDQTDNEPNLILLCRINCRQIYAAAFPPTDRIYAMYTFLAKTACCMGKCHEFMAKYRWYRPLNIYLSDPVPSTCKVNNCAYAAAVESVGCE